MMFNIIFIKTEQQAIIRKTIFSHIFNFVLIIYWNLIKN